MKVSKELKVGVLVVVAAVLLYGGFNFLKGQRFFTDTIQLVTVYDKIEGLTVGNPVILNGFAIGRVDNIEILEEEGYKLRVDMNIRNNFDVPKGSKAVLSSTDLLGGKAITLKMGNGPGFHESGDTIPGIKQAGVSDIVMNKAEDVMLNLDSLITNINMIFDKESTKSARNIRDDAEGLMSNLKNISGDVKVMVENNRSKINTITSNFTDLSKSLKSVIEDTEPLIDNLKSITDTIKDSDIKATVANANKAMDQLKSAMAKLDTKDGTLGMLLNDKELYVNLNKSAEDLDFLLADLQANPQKYVTFNLFGGKEKENLLIKKIKPNPTNEDKVMVKFKRAIPDSWELEVNLYDVPNKTIHPLQYKRIDGNEFEVYLPADLAEGDYVIQVKGGGESEFESIVKY